MMMFLASAAWQTDLAESSELPARSGDEAVDERQSPLSQAADQHRVSRRSGSDEDNALAVA